MTKYVKYTFRNVEPIEIADDSTAQSGQANTLCYIPGSALRGAVIQALIRDHLFEENKSMVLSDRMAFLNAYPEMDGHELIPSMKGFYEDKTDNGKNAKTIENMLKDGTISPGNKRASLGKYCYLKDGCVFYSDMERGSDMKINKGNDEGDRTVFRNQYLMPGYDFSTYIAVHDSDSLAALVEGELKELQKSDSFVLGGSRSFGYGRCELLSVDVSEQLPYAEYMPKTGAKDCVYMMLLSNTSMKNSAGEIVGIDKELLKKRLGLPELEISYCSTSVVDVKGYNRTWGVAVPSVKMYEMGSVFKLMFTGCSISAETMNNIMDEGLGVRNNEGYGRILFLDDYESVCMKKKIEKADADTADVSKLTPDELATLKIAATGYYMNLIERSENAFLADKGNSLARFHLNSSQLGTIESIINVNLYEGERGFQQLSDYLTSAREKDAKKRILKENRSRSAITEYLSWLQKSELFEIFPELPESVMGLSVHEFLQTEEIARIKLRLVTAQIRCLNREGAANE
ncbi:MAG: hypothetical protein LUH14_10785 [Clostridiaceae bacterium]|nr:hypothetical protein [Clostridiaceae bacterium]